MGSADDTQQQRARAFATAICALLVGAILTAATPIGTEQTPWRAHSELAQGGLPSSIVQHELCPDGTKQRSGYVPGSPLFFYLAESRHDPAHDPLAIWVNGGPGSSSLVGMNLSGPCGIVRGEDGRPEMRPSETSWNVRANVLYIDNPRSVGFSKGEFPASHSSYTAAVDFYEFLQGFLRAFPHYAKHDWAFNSGSYGGHYVPVFTGFILHQNARLAGRPSLYDDIFPDMSQPKELAPPGAHIPLKSVSIGNGWIRPRTQFGSNVDFACGAQAARDEGVPMLSDNRTCEWAYERMEGCAKLLEECSEEDMTHPRCVGFATYCGTISETPYESTGLNPYNYHRHDMDDESPLDEFYNSVDVQVKLGVLKQEQAPVQWLAHNMKLHKEYTMSGDFNRRTDHLIERMMRGGVDVLKYEGMVDWICNFIGIRDIMATLPGYKHQSTFNALGMTSWRPFKGEAGSYKCHQAEGEGKLCYLEILGAGHIIPAEKPWEAQAMISSWVSDRTL